MTRSDSRRRARREPRDRGGLRQLPWRRLVNPYPPVTPLSADQVAAIHHAALTVLEDIGMVFMLPEALALLERAGAEVDHATQLVRMDRALVAEHLAHAPAAFTLHARNPERHLHMGGAALNFAAVASAPNCSDLEGGRRPGNHEDYRNLVRLAQSLDVVHLFGGYPVEPVDLHPDTRHLDCLHDFATLGDKVFHAYSLGRDRIRDGIEIARIARGIDHATLEREPSLFTIINSSSPLRLDGPMLNGIMEMAARNQVVVLTPFTLSGAMAPATIAGALAQQHAEAMAGLAFAQMVRPGAPVMYGGFTSNVDMKSGAPAFGTPEYVRAAMAGGQLARHLGIPYRSSNANAANSVDAQAAYESVMSVWGAVMGHANMVMHGAGWMEGGLTASFEKMVLDAEILQTMAEFMAPIVVDDDTLALDAMREVGPGGHFFGAAHTLARYETAFYAPLVSDWRNFESWQLAGSPSAAEHCNRIWKQLLADYQPPPMDEAVRGELDAFVAKRKEEGGQVSG